jgi:4,5-DOPA dioxygenase extradiol
MNRKSFLKSLSLFPFLMNIDSLNGLENWAALQPNSQKMPVLFIGHGSPMNAIEDNQFVRSFKELGKKLPKPKAILCISAHWYTKGTQVMSSVLPKTIYDFGGFPDELYKITYPAPGSPELAKQVNTILSNQNSTLSDDWGLDHGAWTVLRHLFPTADIPVIQLSIDYTKPASYHFEMAKLLKDFRNKGILIVGSGNIIHNLGMIDWANINTDDFGYDWAIEVKQKTNQAILTLDSDFLVRYSQHGKAFTNAIPTPDHYLPLLYSMALADSKDSVTLFNDKLMAGSLSMTSVKFG